ncbi:MAG TPA: roadblock/LC7 domain-containing protein [Candidatus Acidoferrales bacterium]|nr:roadblock/LC7 domain-containing protein [Candidatus Acidoferrales bacterium]
MPQWTLFENDFRSIDLVLAELLERTNALSAHLIDRSGQLITSAGRVDDFDAMSFASLVAADFTANAELAQLLGESGVDAVVSEGRARSIHSCLLADRVILCTVFDRRSTLGLVRFRARRAAESLDEVFRGLFEKVGLAGPASRELADAPDFVAAAANEVDALFGD